MIFYDYYIFEPYNLLISSLTRFLKYKFIEFEWTLFKGAHFALS